MSPDPTLQNTRGASEQVAREVDTAPPEHDHTHGWTPDELATNPHAHAAKAGKVRSMFAAIAHAYDFNNRVHSFWRDLAWRRAAVKAAALRPTDHVLDVACGTGDLSRAFAAAGASNVTGLDFTPQMLDIARTRPYADRINYVEADATALPYPDQSFDVVSIAFGIRNVQDVDQALGELRRVLRPGGRLVVLEFDEPRFPPARLACRLYTQRIMPITATLISRDRSGAYRYLPKSVQTFLDRDQLAARLRDAGFSDIRVRPLSFGVCVCTVGVTKTDPR